MAKIKRRDNYGEIERMNGICEVLEKRNDIGAHYDFYLNLYPHIRRNIGMIAEIDEYVLWIELMNGRKLIFDTCNNTFREPTFGETLNGISKFKHITQKALANRIGVYPSEIAKYMSGEKTPSIYTLQELARALSCSIDDFY